MSPVLLNLLYARCPSLAAKKLQNQAVLQTPWLWELPPRCHQRAQTGFGAPQEAPQNCPDLTCLDAPWKSCIQRVYLYLTCPRTHWEESPIPKVFVKMIGNNCVRSQLLELLTCIEANKRLAKKVMVLGNETSTEGIVKPWQHPGALQGHAYVQSCAHVQEWLKDASVFKSWLNTISKKRLRQVANFLSFQGAPTHTVSLGKGWEAYWLKEWKDIFVQSLVDQKANQAEVTIVHSTGKTNFVVLVQESQ